MALKRLSNELEFRTTHKIVKIIKDIGSCLTIDGKNLPGIWLTKRALKLSAQRAKKYGISTVLIKNSHLRMV